MAYKPKNKENLKREKQLNNYIKFSGIAFQMIAVICVFSYLGVWLDEKHFNNYSAYTIIFSLIGVVLAMYMVIKQVISMSKK